MLVERDQRACRGEPVTTLVTPELTQTGLSRPRCGGPVDLVGPRPSRRRGHPGDRAAGGEDDRGAVGPAALGVRRSAATTRSRRRRTTRRSRRRASPRVHRSVAASNHAWNSALRRLAAARTAPAAAASIAEVVELVPARVDLGVDADQPAPSASPRRSRGAGACRRARPASGAMPRAAERRRRAAGAAPSPVSREHVVVVGAPRRLAVPDQQHLTHQAPMIWRQRRSRYCAAGPKTAYASLVVCPWK